MGFYFLYDFSARYMKYCLVLSWFLFSTLASAVELPFLTVPQQGKTFLFALGDTVATPVVTVDNKPAAVLPKTWFKQYGIEHNGWHALIAVPIEATTLQIVVLYPDTQKRQKHSLLVNDVLYPEESFTAQVGIENIQDPVEQKKFMQRYNKEVALAKKAYQTFSDPVYNWDFPMYLPVVPLWVSSEFGFKRIVNNIPRNPHAGIDLAQANGHPVHAALDGTIILVDTFIYNGTSIFIDHGQGLITSYFHLSKSHVVAEQKVKRGQKIGEVGSTGRVTGAHLHFGVRLNNTNVDPRQFLPLL